MATADPTRWPDGSERAVLAGGAAVAAATAVGGGWLLSAWWFGVGALGLGVVEWREWRDGGKMEGGP